MTGDELKTLAESLEDGQVFDEDLFYSLLNIAKDKVEGERLWQFLKKLDSSQTASSGSNPDTIIPVPNDFLEDYKLEVGINNEYFPVGFEEQHQYRSASRRYFMDLANGGYHLLGNVRGDTCYLFYKKSTDAITASTSPVWPIKYHPILAFMVVGYHQTGIDSDDIFARMGPVNRVAATELLEAMRNWDATLALRAQGDRVGMEGGESGDFPIGMM